MVFLIGIVGIVREEIGELVDHHMEAIAAALVSGVKNGSYEEDPFETILEFETGSFRGMNHEDAEDLEEGEKNVRLLAVMDKNGVYLYRSELYWKNHYEELLRRDTFLDLGVMLPIVDDKGYGGDIDPEARWEARYYQKDGFAVFLALNQHENKDEYIDVMQLAAMALPLALAIVALGGWWIGVFAVRPVESISKVVTLIKAEELGKRVPEGDRDDEIGELARLINDMLERIESGYVQAKRFTADASHELRTPLAILQCELEAKMRDSGNDIEASGRMLEEVRRLKTLTHSLLFLSKADSGTLRISNERVALSPLVKQTVEDMRDLAQDDMLIFEFQEKEINAICSGDASLIQQTLMNLLRNAVKFNRAGGKVLCQLTARDSFWVISVGNNGEEIPADTKEKVFERFYRGEEERSRDKGGFGLGLNIAREIARIHGGDVCLSDSKADWVEFEFTIPKSSLEA